MFLLLEVFVVGLLLHLVGVGDLLLDLGLVRIELFLFASIALAVDLVLNLLLAQHVAFNVGVVFLYLD